jgi:hypothetical protein
MSLNDLNLSATTLAYLYPNSLVTPGDTLPGIPPTAAPIPVANEVTLKKDLTSKTEKSDAATWKYLGNNGKHIVIVVRSADAVHLPDEELSFLTNMLMACKLSLADVAIVNYERHKDRSYKDFIEEFRAQTILLFGIEPAAFNLPVIFPAFQVQVLGNCTFLYSSPLDAIRQDALLKSKLWVSLRSVFNV